jgi:hypothetical protein
MNTHFVVAKKNKKSEIYSYHENESKAIAHVEKLNANSLFGWTFRVGKINR